MKLRSILAVALLATPCIAGAGVTGQATLNNFSYTLTDLDPNDGVTPSITFLPVPTAGASAGAGMLMFDYSAGNVRASPIIDGSSSQPMSADYTAQGLTIGGSLSGAASLDTARLSLYASTDPSFGHDASAYATGNTRRVEFVLSPYTSLTDSGEYNRLSMDGDLWLTGEDANNCCVSQRFTADAGFLSGPVPAFDRIDTILGTYSNDSASSFQGELLMYGSIDALSAASAVTAPTPPVPEPANVAMLGAGLPLLLALRRRSLRTSHNARA
jgi:hypothetical protein